MIYREGRNKMTDYSQFEASTKSGINPDIKRIRKMDEIVGVVLNQRRESKIKCVICIILAVAVFRVKVYLTIIFGLLALFYLWRGTGKIADTYLREIYEEGLLVPGLIVRTQPMAVMAIANIIARGEADTINACYNCMIWRQSVYIMVNLLKPFYFGWSNYFIQAYYCFFIHYTLTTAMIIFP